MHVVYVDKRGMSKSKLISKKSVHRKPSSVREAFVVCPHKRKKMGTQDYLVREHSSEKIGNVKMEREGCTMTPSKVSEALKAQTF